MCFEWRLNIVCMASARRLNIQTFSEEDFQTPFIPSSKAIQSYPTISRRHSDDIRTLSDDTQTLSRRFLRRWSDAIRSYLQCVFYARYAIALVAVLGSGRVSNPSDSGWSRLGMLCLWFGDWFGGREKGTRIREGAGYRNDPT